MGKIKGSYTLGVTFDVNSQKPIDSRMRVEYLSDLTKESTWQIVEGDSTKSIYDGMVVVVMYEGESGKNPCGDVWVLPKADKWNVLDEGTVSTNGGWKLVGGDKIPTEQHKLLYSYDNKTLKPDFLMKEGIYVIDNQTDFDLCKGIKPSNPDILNEWQQYTDRAFMPEYGNGYSEKIDYHISNTTKSANYDSGIGYGHWWSDEDLNVFNNVNSHDYTGYINPQKASKFNYTTIIGSDKGYTTGDWAGYALIDDSNATPRHIICDDGNTYYRNTLYDLTDSDGKRNSDLIDNQANHLWCAWVNEDKENNVAYVIYTKQIVGSDNFSSGYVDYIPVVDETVKIYKVKGIKTKEERTTYTEYDSTTVTQFNESSGYIVTLNILTLNSAYLNYLKNSSSASSTATIVVFTNVFPTNSTNISNDYNVVNYNGRCFIVEPGATNLNDGKLYGCDLVKFNSSLDLNNKKGYSFIRSNIDFNGGVLTLQFSDVNGNANVTMPSDYLNNNNLETNLPLNGSKLVIDFNNGTVNLTPYTANNNSSTIVTNISDLTALTNANAKYDSKGNYDTNGNVINVFDSFKGEVKFMYIAQSMANLMYKCNGFTYEERVIIDVNEGKNEVYTYDPVIGDYTKLIDKSPFDYFTGSHISHNEITEKLWYSNGTKITQIATNCGCCEGENGEGGVAQTMVSITHDELLNLRNTNQLIPGVQYRIIDYITTTTQQGTKSVNNQFDIIAFADDESTLNENVRFTQHSGDTYFDNCNLDAWEGKYCIDNDITRFAWADSTDGKGVIYWLKDEWNNECPYDFKNIQFKRVAISNIEATGLTSDMLSELQTTFVYDNNGGICYGQVDKWGNYTPSNVSNNGSTINYTFDNSIEKYYYTFTWVDETGVIKDTSVVGRKLNNDEGQYSGVFNNEIQPVSQYMFYHESPTEFGYSLNNIVFVSTYSYDGGLFYGYYGNKFGVNCYNNTFGNDFYQNTFGNDCWNNTFGNDFYQNTFGNGCESNTFGNYCNRNTFGNDFYQNTFGNSCYYNTFGNNYGNNTFGNSCWNNTFGNNCGNNAFGNGCESNTFGNGCYYNTFGNSCWNNTFGNGCYYNTFGNGYIKECRFGDGVQCCTISGYEDLGNYGSDYYIRNIVVLNGTKGSYSQLLELNENEIFNTHNFKQDSDLVPQIVCGFFVNENDVMTYITKYYFTATLG